MEFLQKFFPDFSIIYSGDFSNTTAQSQWLSFIIWLFLIIIGASFVLDVYRKKRKSLSIISDCQKHITSLKGKNLVEQRRQINEEAKKNTEYGKIWEEFDQSLVEANNKLYNTTDAAYFFNTHSLASNLVENRLLAAVPGFLTAIGVFGTFVGLTFGLGEIELNAGTEKMQQGIAAMVSGASTAFLTSLWGVLISLLFNWYEKTCEREVKTKIRNLQTTIDNIFHRIVAEQTLTEIKTINQDAHNHLAELSEKIGDQLQRVMGDTADKISTSIIESLATSLSPVLDKLVNNSREGSEKVMQSLIQEFLNKIGNAGEVQKLAMENTSKTLAESSNKMMSHLSSFIEQLDIKLTDVQEGNREMLEQMRLHFSDQVGHIQSQTQQYNQQSIEFMKNLAHSMADFHQKNQEMLDTMGQMVRKNANEQATQFAKREEHLTTSTKQFMEKLGQAIDELNSNNAKTLTVIESTLSDRINAQAEADIKRSNAFNAQIEKGVQAHQALTNSVKEILATQNQQNNQLSTQLGSLSENFNQIVNASNRSITTLNNITDKMKISIADFTKLSESVLNEFSTKLKVMMTQNEAMVLENRNTATLFKQATHTLEHSGEEIAKTAQTLEQTAKITQITFDNTQREFNQFAQQLHNHLKELNNQMNTLLIDYSKQVQAQTNERLNEWNHQTKDFISTASNAMNTLSSVVDEIDTKVRNR